jgi:ribosome-binding factor A
MSHRIERVNNLIRQEISELLQRQIKDPRLDSFVAVTAVVTSPDLRQAKIFVSSISSRESRQEMIDALSGASRYMRKELARSLRLRRIPKLSFHWDDSIERGDHLIQLIDQVSSEDHGQKS